VLSVSNDTLTDPNTREQYYLARVEVKEGELKKLGSFNVVPGMPVEVLISAGERTMLDYLVAPVEGLFRRAMKED
jgi:multidrug efflux pump subunit AcrA (membrane-fusion protein)